MSNEIFLNYQDQAEGMIRDQAKIIEEQKQTIEELREALRIVNAALEQIKKR